MNTVSWLWVYLCLPYYIVSASEAVDPNKVVLQKEVSVILQNTNINQRTDVDKIFKLGDIYLGEGNKEKAIYYYTRGLQVHAWNLEYQLKLADLFRQSGQIEKAEEKARLVFDYAEHEDLILAAKQMLTEMKVKLPAVQSTVQSPVTIVLVPLGSINRTLTEEAMSLIQDIIKVRFVISDTLSFPMGTVDRTNAHNYITRIYESIQETIPRENHIEVMKEIQAQNKNIADYQTRKEYVSYVLKRSISDQEWQKFITLVEKLEQEGQYDADRLTTTLDKKTSMTHDPNVAGYIGNTEQDIYTSDYNFLYGWHFYNIGVMSYHRFTAEFNDEQQNRPRLRERFAKQLISSAFHTFDIPRCTSPLCARAYPNDIEEHDRKKLDICTECRRQLEQKIQEYQHD